MSLLRRGIDAEKESERGKSKYHEKREEEASRELNELSSAEKWRKKIVFIETFAKVKKSVAATINVIESTFFCESEEILEQLVASGEFVRDNHRQRVSDHGADLGAKRSCATSRQIRKVIANYYLAK